MRTKLLINLFFLLPALAWAAPELKGTPEELRQFLHPSEKRVSLRGSAQERAHTDKAIVSLVVTTEEDDLAAALERNTRLRGKFADQLVHAGLDAEGIDSAKFSTSPQYGWFGKDPASYKVINRMTITVTTEQHLQAVAALVDGYKEARFAGTRYEHTQEDAYELKAKKAALDDVMEQARAYEASLNLRLVPVHFHESAVRPVAAREAMLMQDAAGAEAKRSPEMAESAPAPSAASFDEVVYHADVVVEFRVEPAS